MTSKQQVTVKYKRLTVFAYVIAGLFAVLGVIRAFSGEWWLSGLTVAVSAVWIWQARYIQVTKGVVKYSYDD